MEIEKIARKLQPLMPQRVRTWHRIRDSADADVKSLIDKEIVSTAYRCLGDFRNKILLSLPPAKKAKGEIHLGTVLYDGEKWEAGISRAELLQNLAIFGRSGAGKTNVAFHILKQLADKKIPFLFLDWKRTGRHLIPRIRGPVRVYTPGRPLSPFTFNPFVAPPGLEPNVYIGIVVDVLASAYTLGDGARSVLQKAIAACFDRGNLEPTTKDLLTELDRIPGQERVRGWKISAERALEGLAFAGIADAEGATQQQLVESLLHGNTIVELNGLSSSGKQFLIPMLCLWVYYARLGSAVREKLSMVILVEEAHHVLHRQRQSNESVMEMLLRQCREIGIAMIIVDQHPHLISSAALGNTYASVCLNLKDPRDIRRAAELSLVDDSDQRCFSRLPVGQAVVKLQNRWHEPFLIRSPLVPVEKGAVTDQVLKGFIRSNVAGSGVRRAVGGEIGEVQQGRVGDYVLGEEDLRFLGDVLEHRDDGVKQRYRRMGLSVGVGNRIKRDLVDDGWLEEQLVPIGNSRKVLLRLTTAGAKALGLEDGSPPRESLVHAYWKRFYARRFAEHGFRTELEAPRSGGRVDVLATRAGERVGIEIETGESDVVANVRNGLRSRFGRVIVVVTDETALARVERQIASAGLLIPGRIEIVLRDRLGRAVWGSRGE